MPPLLLLARLTHMENKETKEKSEFRAARKLRYRIEGDPTIYELWHGSERYKEASNTRSIVKHSFANHEAAVEFGREKRKRIPRPVGLTKEERVAKRKAQRHAESAIRKEEKRKAKEEEKRLLEQLQARLDKTKAELSDEEEFDALWADIMSFPISAVD